MLRVLGVPPGSSCGASASARYPWSQCGNESQIGRQPMVEIRLGPWHGRDSLVGQGRAVDYLAALNAQVVST